MPTTRGPSKKVRKVVVSILQSLNAWESRDGGAEQVGDSQTWSGRNDDDGP
jgi:hypothetical protein